MRLFWQAWEPDEAPRGIVVIVHGAAEHGGRYAYVAERLVSEGYAAYALDHRGHGRSEGPRAMIGRLDHLVDDLALFLARVTEAHTGRRPFLVGHSLGGAVALTYAVRHGDAIAGLAVSGPAVATDAVPVGVRAAAALVSAVAPGLPAFRIEYDAISRDPEVVRRYASDPLNHNGKLPVRTVAEIMRSMNGMPGLLGTLRTPLLVLQGSEDRLCARAGSHLVYALAASSDKTLRIYDGLYHEVFNEPERAEVVGDLVAWIVERTPQARHQQTVVT